MAHEAKLQDGQPDALATAQVDKAELESLALINSQLASTMKLPNENLRAEKKGRKVLTNSPIYRLPPKKRHGRMMFRTSSWGRSKRQVGTASIPLKKHITPGPAAYKPAKAPRVQGHRGIRIGRQQRPKGLEFLGLGKDMVEFVSSFNSNKFFVFMCVFCPT